MTNRLALLVTLGLLALAASARADEAQTAAELTSRGAALTRTGDVLTDAKIADPSAWTDDDFRKLATLTHLHTLSFGKGVTDSQLALPR